MTEQNEWAVKMWNDTLKEVSTKGDALMDIYDSVCIVRLRQVVEWSLEEMWRIKNDPIRGNHYIASSGVFPK